MFLCKTNQWGNGLPPVMVSGGFFYKQQCPPVTKGIAVCNVGSGFLPEYFFKGFSRFAQRPIVVVQGRCLLSGVSFPIARIPDGIRHTQLPAGLHNGFYGLRRIVLLPDFVAHGLLAGCALQVVDDFHQALGVAVFTIPVKVDIIYAQPGIAGYQLLQKVFAAGEPVGGKIDG